MDSLLSKLVTDLELTNYGIAPEDLLPVVHSQEWPSYIKFSTAIMRYILPGERVNKEYLVVQNKVRSIVQIYWDQICEDNKAYNRIKIVE